MLLANTQIALEETGLVLIVGVSALFLGLAAALLYATVRGLIARRATQGPVERRGQLIRAVGGLVLAVGSVGVWYVLVRNTPPHSATVREDAVVLHYRRGDESIAWGDVKDVTHTMRTGRRGIETHVLLIKTAAGDRRIQVSTSPGIAGLQTLHEEIKQRTRGPLIKLPPIKLNLGSRPAE